MICQKTRIGLLFVVLLYAVPVDACDILVTLEERSSDFVLIGEVLDYAEGNFKSSTTYGLVVRPIHVFRSTGGELKSEYQVFPYFLGPGCGSIPNTRRDVLSSDYPVGTTVAITGVISGSGFPGDVSVTFPGSLSKIEGPCLVDDIISQKYDYGEFPRSCGDVWLAANIDIALLKTAIAETRAEILGRLSNFPFFLDYQSLLEKYVEDPILVDKLMTLRYPEIVPSDCENNDQVDDRTNRAHLSEYCRR